MVPSRHTTSFQRSIRRLCDVLQTLKRRRVSTGLFHENFAKSSDQFFNTFLGNVPILHPLKTLENQRFSGVSRGYKMKPLSRNGKNNTCKWLLLIYGAKTLKKFPYSQPCQTLKMERFLKIVNSLQAFSQYFRKTLHLRCLAGFFNTRLNRIVTET